MALHFASTLSDRRTSFAMKTAVLLSILLVVHISAESATKDVHLPNGPVIGTATPVDGKEVFEFLGIPFAEPPVGKLRFREPQPLTRTWTEPLLANKAPKGCLQYSMDMGLFPEGHKPIYGEDCLYVDVWTPSVETADKKSVMVWIHGGGFAYGEGLPFYNGKALSAIGDVVVVVIQYRVGYMGFARFDDKLVPGNNGLLDQQLALKWVSENIAYFGGDPESVTIFGESAGSGSVAYHMINEESSRYFKRGIMQSGSFGVNSWSFNPNTEALEILNRKNALKYLNCDQVNAKDLLDCLQSKSEEELLVLLTNTTLESMSTGEPTIGPTIDGRFISRSPMDILASGGVSRKDIMIGVTNSEGSLFVSMMAFMIASSQNITGPIYRRVTPELADSLINQYFPYYPFYPQKLSPAAKEMLRLKSVSHAYSSTGDGNAMKLSDVLGEQLIYCTVNAFADAIRTVHDTVYFYEMAHMPSQPLFSITPPEDWMRCGHGDDIPFIFALPLVYPGNRKMTDDELLLSRRMIGDWSHFAKTGAPRDPNWRPFTIKEKGFYRYQLKSSFEVGGVKRDECVFWDKVLPMVNAMKCEKDSESNCKLSDAVTESKTIEKVKDEL